MRVLFVVVPTAAHLYPSVPLARALAAAGHEVCVASHPELAGAITDAGLTAVALGEAVDLGAAMRSAVGNGRLERIADALDRGGDPAERGLRDAFRYYQLAGFAVYHPEVAEPPVGQRAFADELVGFARAWRPDLVLWDPLSFPAAVAARACGAAHARVLYGPDYFGWARTRLAGMGGDPLAAAMEPELRRFGLEFDEEMVVGQWSVDLLPPGMRLPAGPHVRYVPMRRVPYDGAVTLPGWLLAEPERPRVCLTLGMSTRRYLTQAGAAPVAGLLRSLAGPDVEVVATLNRAQLAEVRDIPGNVRLIDYVPLSLLLPTCAAVVHHGGGGTCAAAIAHRVPQLFPYPEAGGDRAAFARHVAGRGAGLVLGASKAGGAGETGDASPPEQELSKALLRLLEEPSLRDGAAALHADVLAQPGPIETVPVLERLTALHRGRKETAPCV
jgi:glycosyltransferase (activator-dependent family)